MNLLVRWSRNCWWDWVDESFASAQMLPKNFLSKQRDEIGPAKCIRYEDIFFSRFLFLTLGWCLFSGVARVHARELLDELNSRPHQSNFRHRLCHRVRLPLKISVDAVNGKLYFGEVYRLMIARPDPNNSPWLPNSCLKFSFVSAPSIRPFNRLPRLLIKAEPLIKIEWNVVQVQRNVILSSRACFLLER